MSRILVGLSGGVDSAVSAYLLQQAGHDVAAGFMRNYTSDDATCQTRQDRDEALRVARHLGIRTFTIFDFEKEYRESIVQYVYDGYRSGITPNPDILCNNLIKFGLFLREARAMGYDRIATGHYARIEEHPDGTHVLLSGHDTTKDQSYFLSGLTQDQLAYATFPIGHLTKKEVRTIAHDIGLPNADREESQGICFVGEVDMETFLGTEIPPMEGDIVDTSGKVVGKHRGVAYYTIGQRRGIRVGGGPALFVVAKDLPNNHLIVGNEDDQGLYADRLHARQWHWLRHPVELPREVGVRIRYRQPLQQGTLVSLDGDRVEIVFEKAQRAITSGQIVTASIGDEVVGSGTIE